jgi:hypothetical protein
MPSVPIHVKGVLIKLYPITYWHSVHQQGQLSAILQPNNIYYKFLSGNHLLFHRFTRQYHLSNQFTKISAQLPGNLQFRRPYSNHKSVYTPENSHQLPSALQPDEMSLLALPVPLHDFIPYIAKHGPKKALEPFKVHESKLREVFAQHPDNAIAADPRANILPLFDGHEDDLRIRARDMSESILEKDKYLLTLPNEERKPDGSPAIVGSMKEFKNNFNLFSESSLVDLDWSNVVAAGSSVVTSLLPVQAPHK